MASGSSSTLQSIHTLYPCPPDLPISPPMAWYLPIMPMCVMPIYMYGIRVIFNFTVYTHVVPLPPDLPISPTHGLLLTYHAYVCNVEIPVWHLGHLQLYSLCTCFVSFGLVTSGTSPLVCVCKHLNNNEKQ